MESDKNPCGCVALEKANEHTCYLERLAVLPKYRRQGFGKRLVNHIFKQAKKIGAQRVEIGIIALNTELRNWYNKQGFIEKNTVDYDHLPFSVTFMYSDF
ncbi:MAG: GNAT family N-acetyltransferase [Candidatus Hermodarchaeota archaeon]